MCSGASLSNSVFTSRWTFQITAQPTAPHSSPPRNDGSDVVRIIQNELNPSFFRTGTLHPDLHTDHSICRVFPSAQTQTEAEAAGQAHPPFAPTSRSSSTAGQAPGTLQIPLSQYSWRQCRLIVLPSIQNYYNTHFIGLSQGLFNISEEL